MAKALARRSSAPRVVVVSAPRRSGRIRRAGRAVARGARRVGSHAKRALPTTAVIIGGLAVGYADGAGFLDRLPAIQGSRDVTLGLLGYAATRMSKNPHVRGAGLAAIGFAAVALGRTQASKGAKGWGGDDWGASGDEDYNGGGWGAEGDDYYG